MKTPRPTLAGFRSLALSLAALSFVSAPSAVFAQKKKSNPASKVYVSDVNGEAQIDTGESIEDIAKRSVYTAEGTVIETKKANDDAERKRAYSTMVYSNGTGAYFDEDTRVEVKRFSQEPFTPNRSDIEIEPSISQTQAFVARGTVGLCNSKLVAGSSMTYQTPQASVNIRGRKLVIETTSRATKISMLEGDSTVRGGIADVGGRPLKAGEQAIITNGLNGQPNTVQIIPIPQNEMQNLDDKVAMACMAKKTVYFEVKEKATTEKGAAAEGPLGTANNGNGEKSAPAPVTAFDDNGSAPTPIREIVPVEIVPVTAPVDLVLSSARAPTPPTPKPGGG